MTPIKYALRIFTFVYLLILGYKMAKDLPARVAKNATYGWSPRRAINSKNTCKSMLKEMWCY